MKNSIGLWIDNELQKKILCFEKDNKNSNNLKSIYQSLYIDPQKALNQIRIHLEKSIKDFLKNEITLDENEFTNKNLNGLIKLLAESPKKEQKFHIELLGNTCVDLINQFDKEYSKEIATKIIDDCHLKSHLVRRLGNSGSHSNEIQKNELREKAFMAFLSFFHIHNILFDETKKCKYFNDFIYDSLEVIYETKDDVEEWEKIRFNKLNFNYNLYQIDISNKKPKLDKIIQKEKESSSKNIYFLNLNDYKNFKKMYQNLEEIDEEDYFTIEKEVIDIDTIDIIPLRLLPKDENNPYKWDMCYINLSIEFDDFGVDLILFLNFNQEKFSQIIEDYELEINTLEP